MRVCQYAFDSYMTCIRRFDTDRTVETRFGRIHADGQIWSQALWEIRQGYVAMRKTTAAWDTTLILSQFEYTPDTTWQAAARETFLVAQALTARPQPTSYERSSPIAGSSAPTDGHTSVPGDSGS